MIENPKIPGSTQPEQKMVASKKNFFCHGAVVQLVERPSIGPRSVQLYCRVFEHLRSGVRL